MTILDISLAASSQGKPTRRQEPQSGAQLEDRLAIEKAGLFVLRTWLISFTRMCILFGLLLLLAMLTRPEASGQTIVSGAEGFETGYDGWTMDTTNIWKVGERSDERHMRNESRRKCQLVLP